MPAHLLRDQPLGEPLHRRRTMRLAYTVLTLAAAATLVLPVEPASVVAIIALATSLSGSAWFFITTTGRLQQSERRAWRLLGVGLLIAALGLVVHGVAWTLVDDVPTFGPVDLFWLVGYGVGIAGIASLPHTAGSRWQRLRLLIDGLIGAVAISTILWTVTLRDVTQQLGSAPVWDRVVGSSYIVLDAILLVVLVTVVIKRSTHRFDRRLVYLGIAIASQTGGDYAFLTSGLGRTFAEVQPVYAFPIVAGMMFLAAGANVQSVPPGREYADRTSAPAWAILVPYGLAASLFGALLVRFPNVGASATDRTLLLAVVVLGALIIARQGVAIRESRRLVDDQRADLAASISHELRTPLTTVVGFLDLLESDGIDDINERREVTTLAVEQAAHLSRIVADLLVLASDGNTQIDLQVDEVAIEQLVDRSIELAGVDPDRVRVDSEPTISAFVDAGRIQQALANLIKNALRYGGDQVQLAVQAGGGDLVIEVHDNGPGVPRKYELLIWEKFERGPHRLNSSAPGSGIGLAMTRAIAQAHGGSTGYRLSDRSGGACFWIRLPGRVQSAGTAAERSHGYLAVVAPEAQTA